MRAQVIALEQPTKETVKEVKKLRIKKDQESTKVQGTATKVNTCSTTITKDVEEPGSEKGSYTAMAAVPFPGESNEETKGNSHNQSKTNQRAGIPSTVAVDNALISKIDDMPGTNRRCAGNGRADTPKKIPCEPVQEVF